MKPRPWPEMCEPTPAQLLDWLVANTRRDQLTIVGRFLTAMRDATRCVLADHVGWREQESQSRYQRRVEHERSLGRAYVGVALDDLCRSVGLDPVQVWRLPRAREELLAGLTHPDRATRQAAEAAWLRAAREHQRRRADG